MRAQHKPAGRKTLKHLRGSRFRSLDAGDSKLDPQRMAVEMNRVQAIREDFPYIMIVNVLNGRLLVRCLRPCAGHNTTLAVPKSWLLPGLKCCAIGNPQLTPAKLARAFIALFA